MTMMNLLIVSDNREFTERMRKELEPRGFNILSAGSAEKALEYVRMAEGLVHCALVAFSLPGMDGLDFVQIVRREGDRMGIVMVTENGRTAVDKQCEGLEIWSTLYFHTAGPIIADKLMEAHAFTHIPVEKEKALVAKFEAEIRKMDNLHKDLLDETTEIPLAGV